MALPGLPVSDPNPGTYINVQFGAGVAAGDLSAKRVLFIAPSTTDGSIVQDTEVAGPFSDIEEVKAKCGVRSPLRRMIEAFWKVNPNTQVYALAPTRSAGVAASLVTTLVAAGGATGPGVIEVQICEDTIEVAFALGDTVTQIMTDLAAAINARLHLPVTAGNAAGVLTLTAVIPGPEGNTLRAKFKITPGVVTSLTNTSDSAFTSGATQSGVTSALATIVAQDFDLLVNYSHSGSGSDTQLTAIANQNASQAMPVSGVRGVVLSCCSLAASTFATLCASINKPRVIMVNLEESPVEPWVFAGMLAGVFANTYFVDPASNLAGYGTHNGDILPIPAPRNKGAWFTRTERTVQLNSGGTPLGVTPSGQVYITRLITTRCLDGSAPDYKTRDAHKVFVADRFADDWNAKVISLPYRKLTADLPEDSQDPEPGALFATPKRLRAVMEQLVTDQTNAGYLDPAKKAETLSTLTVAIEPLNNTIANISVFIFAAPLLLQTRTNVAEASPAA